MTFDPSRNPANPGDPDPQPCAEITEPTPMPVDEKDDPDEETKGI